MEDDSEFEIDTTGYDKMIRQAVAEVIAEKFMSGEMYLKIVDEINNSDGDIISRNGGK